MVKLPARQPVQDAQLDVPRLLDLPDGVAVYKYGLTPKLWTEGWAYPGYWHGPDVDCPGWTTPLDTRPNVPDDAHRFPDRETAIAAMRAAGLAVHPEDLDEQTALF